MSYGIGKAIDIYLLQQERLHALSSCIKLRNFDNYRKDKQQNVHVGCISSLHSPYCIHTLREVQTYTDNTILRGQT